MFMVVSYDIVNDRRRTKVHKTLKDFGTSVQYSVFECELDAKALKRLGDRLERLIEKKEDSIRFYFQCGTCRPRIRVMGVGKVTSLDPFRIV